MNVAISQLVEDFDTTVTTVQGVITFYALVMATLMLTGGKIGDIIGRRRAPRLRDRFGADGSIMEHSLPALRLVDSRGHRCGTGHAGPGRPVGSQLSGPRPDHGIRRHRRCRGRRHRRRADHRRLLHHQPLLALGLRRRGDRGLHHRSHRPTDRGREARRAPAEPRHRGLCALRHRARTDRVRNAPSERLGLAHAEAVADRTLRLRPHPVRGPRGRHRALEFRPLGGPPGSPGTGPTRPARTPPDIATALRAQLLSQPEPDPARDLLHPPAPP
jgi:hypothetical protein